MTILDVCRAALARTNVQAFLRVIRSCEGTADERGYKRHFGGDHFESFDAHPKRAITKQHGSQTLTSTAAGAYQFLAGTWAECQEALGLTDFSPPSQDLAAVFLIRRRGALDDVVAGRFETAIGKCAKEWASLPGSPYGQPVRTMAHCRQVYEQHGGTYTAVETEAGVQLGPEAPAVPPPSMPNPPRPDAEPYVQEASMPIPAIVTALLPTVVQMIPRLASIFKPGSEVAERNVAAASAVIDIVTQATGAINAQEAVEKIQTDPAALQAATKAVERDWFDLHKAAEDSIAAARVFGVSYAQDHNVRVVLGQLTFLEVLSLLLVLTTMAGGMAVMIWGGIDAQLKGAIVTLMLIGGYTAVTQFWFGSSLGSKKKDDK